MKLKGANMSGFLVVQDKEHFMIYKEEEFIESCFCGELSGTIRELRKMEREKNTHLIMNGGLL